MIFNAFIVFMICWFLVFMTDFYWVSLFLLIFDDYYRFWMIFLKLRFYIFCDFWHFWNFDFLKYQICHYKKNLISIGKKLDEISIWFFFWGLIQVQNFIFDVQLFFIFSTQILHIFVTHIRRRTHNTHLTFVIYNCKIFMV